MELRQQDLDDCLHFNFVNLDGFPNPLQTEWSYPVLDIRLIAPHHQLPFICLVLI